MKFLSGKKEEKKTAEGARSTRKDLLALTLSVVIALVVLNFLSSRHFLRFDLTEGNEYTLSDSTKEILKNLDDVVNIRLYFSKDLPPALTMLKRDVDDVLAEYKTYAGQKLNVQFIDPQETPQREQQVMMMGIPPVQLNVIEKDKAELVKVFLGMAVIHEDRREIIPVVQRSGTLEYDLSSAILKVSSKETPRLVWLSGEGEEYYRGIKELLKRRYTIKDATPQELELDSGRDALLVIATEKDLSDAQLFTVDQYLMKGGKAIALVDRIKVGNNLQTSMLEVNNILGWLKDYNIEVKDKLLMDRSNTHAAFSGGYVTYHVPYPFWVNVGPQGFDAKNPAVSDLSSLIFPWVSPLEIGAERAEGVEYTVLAQSSPFNKVVGLDASLLPNESQKLLRVPETEPKPLVVLASGKLTSAFGGDKRPAPDPEKEIIATAEMAQLIVIGDNRFVQDNFLRQFRTNTIFFENIVDYMAMGNQLIGIRSKGVTNRPLEEISSAGVALAKYLNILGPPVVLVGIGLVVLFLRRQRRQLLKTAFK